MIDNGSLISAAAICVRYGLAIGARTAWMVLVLMYLMYPIAYPTALLLDYFLGESHGTVYKKAGNVKNGMVLKTFILT